MEDQCVSAGASGVTLRQLVKQFVRIFVRPKVTSLTMRTKPGRCVICHDDSWEFLCGCGAAYHRECWLSLKTCATRGCLQTVDVTRSRIAERAYFIWKERGGDERENWYRAEREILR